jgi:hypothetical protein
VAVAVEATLLVVAVNVPVVLPAATVTVAGIETSVVSLLLNVTTAPAGPAAPVRVTVPVELVPPITDAGDIAMLATVATWSPSVADCEVLL